MGVPYLEGHINHNKELDFIASISNTENFEDDSHVLENLEN